MPSYLKVITGEIPVIRTDGVPWAKYRIERSLGADGPWVVVAAATNLIPLDPDPANPQARSFTFPDTEIRAYYRPVWIDAANVEDPGGVTYYDNEEGGAGIVVSYASPQQLRDELGLTAAQLGDAAAAKLIASAEDQVDGLLGTREVGEDTGRRVQRSEAEAWQWAKLSRATVKLAAAVHADPALLAGNKWSSVSGPEFAFSGPTGAGERFGSEVEALLTQSGLRRLTTTVGPRREDPPWHSFSHNAGGN